MAELEGPAAAFYASLQDDTDHEYSVYASLEDDTDLTIKLGHFKWRVHSQVLSKYSSFFNKATNGNWKEAEARLIELHDDNPWIFARLLQFFYCGGYGGCATASASWTLVEYLTIDKIVSTGREDPEFRYKDFRECQTNPVVMHLMVYEMAEKYGCNELKLHARAEVDSCDNEIGDLIAMLKDRNIAEWKELIERDIGLIATFADKVGDGYRDLEYAAANSLNASSYGDEEDHPEDIQARAQQWLDWVNEDPSFCLRVLNVMKKYIPSRWDEI